MLFDGFAIPVDPNIRYIGYNIEQGKIIAEKIYYRVGSPHADSIYPPLISEMMDSIRGIRLTSVENASIEEGISKYDFLISDFRGWVETVFFLRTNVSYYKPTVASLVGMISWLRFRFTSVGIRFNRNLDKETELYYRKIQRKKVKPSFIAKRILTSSQYNDCNTWIKMFCENNGWIRSAGISFKRDQIMFKLYLETSDTTLKNKVLMFFKGTNNYGAFKKILEYTDSMNLIFRGIGLVMDKKMNNLRYNFYFTQH